MYPPTELKDQSTLVEPMSPRWSIYGTDTTRVAPVNQVMANR
jgi:hypothetical protein